MQESAAQAQQGFWPGKKPQHPERGTGLRDHRGQGRPPHSHLQPKNKHRIQHNVYKSSQPYSHHPSASKPLHADKWIHTKPDHNKNRTKQINGHISAGIRVSGVAGAEQIQNWSLKGQKHYGDRRTEQQQEREGIPHNPLRLFVVPPAPADGTQRRAAGAAQIGKSHNNRDDRQSQPYPG